MAPAGAETLRIVVRGRVQGVGFRMFTAEVARRLGVSGWVRNLPGGDVEVLARVEAPVRQRFLAALREGPPMARVERMDVKPAGDGPALPQEGFRVLR